MFLFRLTGFRGSLCRDTARIVLEAVFEVEEKKNLQQQISLSVNLLFEASVRGRGEATA